METSEGSRLSDERLEILRLVEDQTISADEASRLLEALDRSERSQQPTGPIPLPFNPPQPPRRPARNVRIRISDGDTGDSRVNLVLPYRLLDSGLKMAKRFAPESLLEASEIKDSVEEGFQGHLLDIVDGDQRVEILVEGSGDKHEEREHRRAMAELIREQRQMEKDRLRAERDRIREQKQQVREQAREREEVLREQAREREEALRDQELDDEH